jgi:hypothetical protein
MTPEELSERHPTLFHITLPDAWDGIREHGLLPTSRLLDFFEVKGTERDRLESRRRPAAIPIHHPRLGTVVLNDQTPLSEAKLAQCLDDDLSPADWLMLLNRRVFFWSDEKGLLRLLRAKANRSRVTLVLEIDTLALASVYADKIEICPINSGATIHKPARRGLSTFTPLRELSYEDWSRKRGKRDKILEVTVLGGVPDVANYVRRIRREPATSPPSHPTP